MTINVNCPPRGLFIGHETENGARALTVDFSAWAAEYSTGTLQILFQRPGTESPYAVVLTRDGTTATWKPSETDLAEAGTGAVQIIYTVGDVRVKTSIIPVMVEPSLGVETDPPDGWTSWIDQLTDLAAVTEQHAASAAESAENAGDSATDAQRYATDAGDAKNAAVAAAEAAAASASHYPQIVNGVWYVWSPSAGAYISTGIDAQGEDGVSPTVEITAIQGGHRVVITDAEGSHTFDVMDGVTPDLSAYRTAADQDEIDDAQDEQIDDLKSALLKSASAEIPCTIYPFTDKANLTLSDYSGKHVFISNKNLLPQIANVTDHGVTCTQNADGSITLSGTADGAASLRIPNSNTPQIGKGTYTLSVMNPSAVGDNSTYFELYVNGSQAAKCQCKLNTANNKITFTLDDGETITSARLRISSGVVIPSNYTLYPQLEAGTEKTDFVAHEGSNLTPTTSPINDVAVFPEYTYICADSGVTGSVDYYINSIDILDEQVSALDERVTALEAKKFTGKKIVCFGDSITGNYQPPSDYPSMIAEITGATVYNAGFGGCCMSDNGQTRRLFTMCRLTDAIVAGDFSAQRNSGVSITYGGTSIDYVPSRLTMLEGIDWSDIDYITIAYGTNDWNGNYGLDNANDPLDTTTYIGAFRYSVEKLLAAYPNIKIMVLTPLWRWWDTNTGMPSEIHTDYIDSNDYAKGTGYKLWQYGDALVAAAKLYHIPVFDLYWNCMMTKQNRLEYFNATDGTHPKLAGIQMMSEMISAHMESVY